MWACYNGELDKVKRVSTPLLHSESYRIENCPRLVHNCPFNPMGRTPLWVDGSHRKARVLILSPESLPVQLLADKTKTDVNASNLNKMTALHVAVQRDHEDVIRELLRHGAGTHQTHPHIHTYPSIHRQVAHGKRGAHSRS